jgi:hypothetical protein
MAVAQILEHGVASVQEEVRVGVQLAGTRLASVGDRLALAQILDRRVGQVDVGQLRGEIVAEDPVLHDRDEVLDRGEEVQLGERVGVHELMCNALRGARPTRRIALAPRGESR